MNPDSQQNYISPRDWARHVLAHRRRWFVSSLIVGFTAVAFIASRPQLWEVSQALILRDEATGATEYPGEFRYPEQMKVSQETVLELVRSKRVLQRALEEVGPTEVATRQDAWPSDEDIAQLRGAIRMTPPKGLEFGTSEVFYLKVKAPNRRRAVALAHALFEGLTKRLGEVRDARAQSMIDESEQAAQLSEADLHAAIERLTAMEREVGSDLAELRILHQSPSDASELRRKAIELETNLREARTSLITNRELLKLLEAAAEDAGQLLAAPSRLLESQPSLHRLRDGLVDAQLRTAELQGSRTELHPEVKAASAGEIEIARHIHAELPVAIRGLQADLRLNRVRIVSLEEELRSVHQRLIRLAGMRAEYSNLVAAVEQQTKLVETARRNLAGSRTRQVAAQTTSLIAMIGSPDPGDRPLGASRALMALAGLAGGLVFGLGFVFLTVEPPVVIQSTKHAGTSGTPLGHRSNGAARPHSTIHAPAPGADSGLSLKQALSKVV